MKKLTKILVIALSLALLVAAVVITASAAEKSYEFDESNEAFVVYESEADFKADKLAKNEWANAGLRCNYLGDALSYAKDNSCKYIALVADWELGEKGLPKGSASFNLNISGMTLDLNGHTMSFSVYTGYTKSDGTRADAYQWLVIGESNVTIVGNGGTIEGVMSLIQNSASRTLNLVGGENGLTLRSIAGKQVSTDGTWSDYTSYAGTYMLKFTDASPVVNMNGEINFELKNTNCKNAVNYNCSATINVGTADGERTYISCVDTRGTSGLGANPNMGGLFYITKKTNNESKSSTINIVNTDVNLMSERLFGGDYFVTTDYGIQYVNIDNCKIVADDHSSNGDGNVNGLIRINHSARFYINVTNSDITTEHGIKVLSYFKSPYNATTPLGYTKFTSCKLTSRGKDGYSNVMTADCGNLVFEDCYLTYGYAIANNGIRWTPYDESKTYEDYTWSDASKLIGGVGILVKEGCTFPGRPTRSGTDSIGAFAYGSDSGAIGEYISGKGANALTTAGSDGFLMWYYSLERNSYVRMLSTPEHKNTIVTSGSGIQTFNAVASGEYFDGSIPAKVTSTRNTILYCGSSSAPRAGKYTYAKALAFNAESGSFEASDNQYVTHSYWADTEGKTYAKDSYYTVRLTGLNTNNYSDFAAESPTFSGTKAPTYTVDDIQYYSADFDLMTPSDKFATGLYIGFGLKTYKSNGTSYDVNYAQLKLDTSGKWTSAGSGGESYVMDYERGVWQHVTIVLEMPANLLEDGTRTVDFDSIGSAAKLHLYVNGALCQTFTDAVPSDYYKNAVLDEATGKHTYCAVGEVRFGFNSLTTPSTADNATAFDNLAVAQYPINLGMSLDDVKDYMGNAAKALGISAPADLPVASYGSVGITARDPEPAILEYVRGASNGSITDVLTLYSNVTVSEAFEAALEGVKSFTYKGNGYSILGLEEYCNISYNAETDTYLVSLKSREYTVNWYDLDGTLLSTETLEEGSVLTVPDSPMLTESNGWYKTEYAWFDKAGNEITDGYELNGNLDITKSFKQYVPYVTVASYTLKLMTQIELEFFIAEDNLGADISNVKFCGNSAKVKMIGDVAYLKFATGIYSGVVDFSTVKSVPFSFDVTDGEGRVHTLTSEFKTSVEAYVSYVVANQSHYVEERSLIADLLQYHVELYKALYPSEDVTATAYYQLLSAVSESATDLDTVTFNKAEDLTAAKNLSSYVDGISFVANGYASAFQLNLKSSLDNGGYVVTDVAFVIGGYLAESTATANAGTVIYGVRSADGEYQKDVNGSYTLVRSINIPVYNVISDELKILLYVSRAGEDAVEVVSGTYSFDAYAASVLEKYPDNAILPFLKAMKACAISAAEYRYGGKKVYGNGCNLHSDNNGDEICDYCDEIVPNVTKSSDHDTIRNVYPGDDVTYTITAYNKGDKSIVVTVTDKVPTNTTYKNGDAISVDGDDLTFSFTVKAGESASVSYTVKAGGEELEGQPIASTALAYGKAVESPALYIGRTFSEGDMSRFARALYAMKDSTMEGVELRKFLYYIGYSASPGFSSDADAVIEQIFIDPTMEYSEKYTAMVVPGLYGGKAVTAEMSARINGESEGAIAFSDIMPGDFLCILPDASDPSSARILATDGIRLFDVTKRCTILTDTDVLENIAENDYYALIRSSIRMPKTSKLNRDGEIPVGSNDFEKALIATAEAFMLRGDRLQYGDDYLRNEPRIYRWERNHAPEESTTDEWGYTNCTGFVHDVYYNVFGYSYGSFTLKNAPSYMKAYIYNFTHNETDEQKAAIEAEYRASLQVGDIVFYTYSGNTHAMLYIGNNTLMHSTGSTFSNSAEVCEATVRYASLDQLFNEGSSRYVFQTENPRTTLYIIRPLNYYGDAEITETARARMDNMKGIFVEKLPSKTLGQTINPGELLTYTFNLFNSNNKEVTFTITDLVPELTTLVENGVLSDKRELEWSVTLGPLESTSVSYTVMVSAAAKAEDAIVSTSANVGGIPVKATPVFVGRTLTDEEKGALVSYVKSLMGTLGSATDGVALANSIYKEVFGIENLLGADYAELTAGLFIADEDGINFSIATDGKYGAMIAPSLYGGRVVSDSERFLGERTRMPYEWHLEVGDILYLASSDPSGSRATYIYLGDGMLLGLNQGLKERDIVERLQDTIGWAHFVIIRPSLAFDVAE